MDIIKSSAWFFIILLTSSSVQADFEAAGKAYAAGKYEEAFQQYLEVAQQGDHSAQFNLGAMFYRGQGTEQNFVEGYAWIALATQEVNEKWTAARQKLFESLSDDEKKQAATRSRELLTLYGDETLIEKISPVLLPNADCDYKLKRKEVVMPEFPLRMLEKEKTGWVDMTFTVAKDGTTRNHSLVSASNAGFVASAVAAVKQQKYEPPRVNDKPADIHGVRYRILYRLKGGAFSPKQVHQLIDDQRVKAETGNAEDKYQYAYLLELVPSYTKISLQDKDTNVWYLKSALAGYGPSQFFIGRNLMYGKGCKQEPQKGMRWLTEAARKSQPDAQFLLAVELIDGARVERREKQAFQWLEQASANHYLLADTRLAWIYSTHPDPSIRDIAKARTHLDKIAAKYLDTVTLNETRAAVSAGSAAFKDAVKFEQDALKEAVSLDFPPETLAVMQARLQSYQNGAAWREPI